MLTRAGQELDPEAEHGFTLVELLVVTIVIGILAAIAIPVLFHQRGKSYNAAVRSDLRNAATAEEGYLAENDSYSTQSPVGSDLTGQGFKYSRGSNYQGGVASIVTHLDPAGHGFCLTSTSASGDVLVWDSTAGGLVPENTGCSF